MPYSAKAHFFQEGHPVEYRIDCINKPQHDSPHEAITHVGYIDAQAPGGRRHVPVDAVIAFIVANVHKFYVEDASANKAYVKVMPPKKPGGKSYIQTEADGKPTDNLLYLKECGRTVAEIMG